MSLDLELLRLLRYRAGCLGRPDRWLVVIARYGSVGEVALMLWSGIRRGGAGHRAVARCLLSVATLYALVEIVGHWVKRPRPFISSEIGPPLIHHEPERSFPSRHVASAVAMATITARIDRSSAALMAILAVGLGLSRIRAGLHYPSDVAGGAALGYVLGQTFRGQESGESWSGG